MSRAPGSIDHAAAAADHAVSHFRASNLHTTYAKKERKSVEVQQRGLLALNTPLRFTALDPRPEQPHVATGLENYAALLRNTGRNDEAAKLEARAKAIRAKHSR